MLMKLAKLLGVGTSFFGGGKTASYRLNQRGSLPKFNEGRNPFAPKAPEVAPEPPPAKIVVPAAVPAPKAPAAYAFKPATKPVGKPMVPPTAKVARPGWTTRLNPFRAPESMPSSPPCGYKAIGRRHCNGWRSRAWCDRARRGFAGQHQPRVRRSREDSLRWNAVQARHRR